MADESLKNQKGTIGLLLNAGLLIVFTILCVAIYKIVSGRESYPDPVYFFFVIALAAGGMGSVFICFRPLDWKINFLLCAVSTFVALYLIEVGLQSFQFFKLENVTFDSRTATNVVAEYKSKGRDLWSFEIPPFQQQQRNIDQGGIYALASPSNADVITCNETGQWNIIKTDEHGFNNPPINGDAQEIKVALVGDSFTHGGCTPGEYNIGFYLRQNGISTRNLGVMGSGPLHQLAVLSEYGKLYNPNTVLWLYYEGNDIGDLFNESSFAMLTKYKVSTFTAQLSDKQRAVDEYLMNYQSKKFDHLDNWRPDQNLGMIKKTLKLETVRRVLGLMGYQIDAQRIISNFDFIKTEFEEVAKAMKRVAESWGGKLIFVYIPDGTRFDRVQRFDYWKQDFVRIVKSLSIPIWDYHLDLKDDLDPMASFNLRRPAHFSAHGNKRLANFLKTKIK